MPGLTKPKGRKNYYATYYDEDGTPRTRSLGTPSKTLAKPRLEKFARDLEAKKWGGPAKKLNPTVDEFWEAYSRWMAAELSGATIAIRNHMWKNVFLRDFKPTRLGDVDEEAVEAHRLKWIEKGGHPTTWNNFRRDMNAIYNTAIKKKLPVDEKRFEKVYNGVNPFAGTSRIPKAKTVKFAISADQARLVLVAAQEHTAWLAAERPEMANSIDAVIALAYFAGLRKAEIQNARWEWVDWDGAGSITPQDGHRFRLKTATSHRTIPMHPELRQVLEPLRQDAGYIYLPNRSGANPSFRRSFGSVIDRAVATQKDAGDTKTAELLGRVTPHILRHSFGSVLIQRGTDLAIVSKLMGHSSIQVTADIYFHLRGFSADLSQL